MYWKTIQLFAILATVSLSIEDGSIDDIDQSTLVDCNTKFQDMADKMKQLKMNMQNVKMSDNETAIAHPREKRGALSIISTI